MEKYREKSVWVDVRDVEEIFQKLVENLKRKAEKERNADKPMNAVQIAEFLNVHKYLVYRWVREEGLPVMKLSAREWRFNKDEVKKWMKSRQETKR